MALFQCFVIPPVLYRSALLFSGVSIVLVVLRCSGGVPLFQRCSVLQRVFRVPVFRWCFVVPALFRRSAGVPCSVVTCSGVLGFIVCPAIWGSKTCETPSKFVIFFHVKHSDFRFVTWFMSIFKFGLPHEN